MPRRKKKRKQANGQKNRSAAEGPFNPALEELGKLKTDEKQPTQQPEAVKSNRVARPSSDAEDFLKAVADVVPLRKEKPIFTRTPDPETRPAHSAANDELEALAHLSDLVSGTAQMDISFSDEYIEGSIPGLSRKIRQSLKKGRIPVGDYVDLHGLTKQEAEARLRAFLMESFQRGLRCVLVVHGRGLNSENNIPVLKERLPVWLNRSPLRKMVMGFSTAMPYDCGTGAVYILLRKNRGRILSVDKRSRLS